MLKSALYKLSIEIRKKTDFCVSNLNLLGIFRILQIASKLLFQKKFLFNWKANIAKFESSKSVESGLESKKVIDWLFLSKALCSFDFWVAIGAFFGFQSISLCLIGCFRKNTQNKVKKPKHSKSKPRLGSPWINLWLEAWVHFHLWQVNAAHSPTASSLSFADTFWLLWGS